MNYSTTTPILEIVMLLEHQFFSRASSFIIINFGCTGLWIVKQFPLQLDILFKAEANLQNYSGLNKICMISLSCFVYIGQKILG